MTELETNKSNRGTHNRSRSAERERRHRPEANTNNKRPGDLHLAFQLSQSASDLFSRGLRPRRTTENNNDKRQRQKAESSHQGTSGGTTTATPTRGGPTECCASRDRHWVGDLGIRGKRILPTPLGAGWLVVPRCRWSSVPLASSSFHERADSVADNTYLRPERENLRSVAQTRKRDPKD